jgi:hypothetical protein
MGSKKKLEYALACVYDTETTNIDKGADSRAFPCLYICNDIRGISIADYEIGRDDNIKFFRHEAEMISYIDDLVEWGKCNDLVPIICAYNLMFDMQPLMEDLAEEYEMEVCAQSSTHVYTLDLIGKNLDGKETAVLRFWDTFYLEMRGLAAMGETCGLPKAVGDWDYTKIRTQETKLTKQELFYAGRDTQVIPAYLKYLMKANSWLSQNDFGVSVMTKTSLVRQMAKHKIGNIKIDKSNGKKITLNMMFEKLCYQELPSTFRSYGIRKACFRGGLTFTSARYASRVVENVASLDVTSMHHAFINGRQIPVEFKFENNKVLEEYYSSIVSTPLNNVLKNYDKPFFCACNMLIRFDNLRLKKGSCFDVWGIATIPSSKFRSKDSVWEDRKINNYANIYSEELMRLSGYKDKCKGATFAYGKLYSAETAFLHVTEIELYLLTRVYEWDSHECIMGEVTRKFKVPPDYITLQSNLLFGMKTDVKNILKKYRQGTLYKENIPETIPTGIALNLKAGSLSEDFLNSYYTSTVKGQFNSIYGTQAQDIYKPEYMVDEAGSIEIDERSVVKDSNWIAHQPNHCKVLYTYGTRIVGGSRLHLVLAMELLYRSLKGRVAVTGGDTDSLKISCERDVSDDDLLEALSPLHIAITQAIDRTQDRVREEYPKLASDLKHIGCFDVEDCGGSTRYVKHMEAWNKARISLDIHNNVHITCAGLSRPEGKYNINDYTEHLLEEHSAEEVFPIILGFNTFIYDNLSYGLEMHRPKTTDLFDEEVTDYKGFTNKVKSHESVALYKAGRWFGELSREVNLSSIKYVKSKYNRSIDTREKLLSYEKGKPLLYIDGKEVDI